MGSPADWLSAMKDSSGTISHALSKNLLSGSSNELVGKYNDLLKARNILDLARSSATMGQNYSMDASSVVDDIATGVEGAVGTFKGLVTDFQSANGNIGELMDKAATTLFDTDVGDVASGVSLIKDGLSAGKDAVSGLLNGNVGGYAITPASLKDVDPRLADAMKQATFSNASSYLAIPEQGFNMDFNSINFLNSNTTTQFNIGLAGIDLGSISASYKSYISDFISQVKSEGLLTALSSNLTAALTSVGSMFTDFGNNFSLDGLMSLVDGIKNLVSGICAALSDFLNFDFNGGNLDFLSRLLEKLKNLLSSILNAISSLLGLITKLLGMLFALIGSLLNIIAQFALECMGMSSGSLLDKCCGTD